MTGDATRWLVLVIVVAGVAGSIYYEYENRLPCAHPIEYSIGVIDPRFDISTSTLLSAIGFSADIWNKAAGKDLLEYAPGGALKINLVYDARQSSATLGAQIAASQADADSERASIELERAQLTPQDAAAFNTRVAAYNASVRTLNSEINQYNQTAGHTFEEGEYIRDASGSRILIYEFIGSTQLERVLAHELGHAIGLGHNADPASIMYAENESGNLTPTADDLAALKAVCGSEISIK